MGAGYYSKVVFGCTDIVKPNKKRFEDNGDELHDLGYKHGIDFSYEGKTRYAGVSIVDTMDSTTPLDVGVVPIAGLEARVRALCAKKLAKAEKTWAKFRAAAEKKGWVVPEGELLWADDYD